MRLGRALIAMAIASCAACLPTTDLDALRAGRGAEGGAPTADGGGAPLDGAATTGCKDIDARFCADFDNGNASAGWTDDEKVGGGSYQTDNAISWSPPGSLAALTPEIDGTSVPKAKARLATTFTDSASQVHLQFKVRLDDASTSSPEVELAVLAFSDGTTDYSLYILSGGKSDRIAEDGRTGPDHYLETVFTGGALKRGGWSRVDVTVSLATQRATVVVDDKTLASPTLAPPFGMAPWRLRVGLSTRGPATAFGAHFDDVIVE